MRETVSDKIYDVIIVGAGISGLVFLKQAVDEGLRCVVLEKLDDVGGLWTKLPGWQDIQNKLSDFAINGLGLEGPSAQQVHRFVEEWVSEYELEPHIRLSTRVTSVSRDRNRWCVRTAEAMYESQNLVIASGMQSVPYVPEVRRTEPRITERHSSEVVDPGEFRGRRVTVVGGGTSGWDLLEQALKHDADEIHWVYRSIKWSLPTRTVKQRAWPNIREMAVLQTMLGSIDAVNVFLRGMLDVKYRLLGLDSIKPETKFDQRRHQLPPGRSLMSANLRTIRRHQGEIDEIDGKEIRVGGDGAFRSDIIAWATGYRMDLSYLGLPEYDGVARAEDMFPKLGYLIKSRDYPDMFFVGLPLLGSTTATPFASAVESKTIVAHILDRCRIPDQPITHLVNHWDLCRYFSRFDTYNYTRFDSTVGLFLRALYYMVRQRKTLQV